ncbi:MAG: hypothetical protein Q4C60_03330 [Eubacteriales bacterium]|nr:hypothetical protein [Eubacteriales bacterium]
MNRRPPFSRKNSSDSHFSIRYAAGNIVLGGILVAVMEAAKLALSFLPNIELVSLLVILYALEFPALIFCILPVFVLVECGVYGMGLWVIMYLYSWPVLAILARLFRRQNSPLFWAILSGSFGLCFGALCALVYLPIGGPSLFFTTWVSGIPYDLLHFGGNFVLCLCLFAPLRRLIRRCKAAFPELYRDRQKRK